VITSAAGYPLDLTFYQGIKGIVAAAPIVKPGGTIIIAQENSEGIGSDEFADIMLHTRDAREHVQRALAGNTSTIDQWQLHVLEKVLRKCEVLNYCTGLPADTQRELFVTPVDSVEAGLEAALGRHGTDAKIAVIPDGPYVLCEVAG